MRNLKKVLSLALALVMLLGMMVVGAGAAYTDQADIANEEAVEVLNALDVIKGFDDGSYKPENTMTRAQAAVVIARMLLGDSVKNLTVVSSRYSDVKTDFWAAKEIEFCSQMGIVSGVGNGKYNPNGNVTGAQFAKMLLCALGYDEAKQGYTGDNWANNVANDARKAGLIAGVTISNEAMTRDGMAQLAFNTLTADIVEYTGRDIQIGEIVIPGSNATKIMHAEGDDLYTGGTAASSTSNAVKFCEQYLPTLTVDTADEDELGHAAKTWKVDGGDVYTKVTETPTMTLRGENYKANTLKDYTDSDDIEVYYNGSEVTDSRSGEWYTAMRGKYGVTIEVYCTAKAIDKVVVVEPFLTEVTNVNAKTGDITLKVYEAGYYIGHGSTYKTVVIDDEADDYTLVEDMEKGDVFMGVFNSGWDANDRQPLVKVLGEPETMTGKVTAMRVASYYTGTVTIDGTKYPFANEYSQSALAVKDEGTFYLYDGSVYHFDKAKAEDSTDYAIVLRYGEATNGSTINGKTYQAQLLLTDGTNKVVDIDTFDGDAIVESDAGDGEVLYTAVNVPANQHIFVSYTVEDGVYSLNKVEDNAEKKITVGAANTAVTGNTAAYMSGRVANNETVFLLNINGKVTRCVGIADLPSMSTNAPTKGAQIALNGVDTYVYLAGTATDDSTSSAQYAYLIDKTLPTQTENGSEYEVIIDGEATTLVTKTPSVVTGIAALDFGEGVTGGIVSYTTTNDLLTAVPTVQTTTYATNVVGNVLMLNGAVNGKTAWQFNDKTVVYLIDGGEPEITSMADIEIETGDEGDVIFVVGVPNSDVAATIWVIR